MKKLKTKRLQIIPQTTWGIDRKNKSKVDESGEKDQLWYADWEIQLQKDGTTIGTFCFQGPPTEGTVGLSYEMDEPYQKQGYGIEAVKAAIKWAFDQHNVYFVRTNTNNTDLTSIQDLKDNGFLFVDADEEKTCWRKEKPASNWMPIFMCIGIVLGSSWGSTFGGDSGLGIPVGMCVGMAIGIALDEDDKKKRNRYKKNQ